MEWISVKDRLPEHGRVVLFASWTPPFERHKGFYKVVKGLHFERFTEPADFDRDYDYEYAEDEDKYYMKEGWCEIEHYEYGTDRLVSIHPFEEVTHWAVLPDPPEPPKEEQP